MGILEIFPLDSRGKLFQLWEYDPQAQQKSISSDTEVAAGIGAQVGHWFSFKYGMVSSTTLVWSPGCPPNSEPASQEGRDGLLRPWKFFVSL